MKSREFILGELKRAKVVAHHQMLPEPAMEQVFKDYPDKNCDLLDLYQERSQVLKIETIVVKDFNEARVSFERILLEEHVKKVVASKEPIVRELLLEDLKSPAMISFLEDGVLSKDEFASADIGITSCRSLVARTGSIVLDVGANKSRIVSVLPPTHVVIAKASQVVTSLQDVFSELVGGFSSQVTVINGPSRTADIEKILVFGAHGPKRVVVIIIK